MRRTILALALLSGCVGDPFYPKPPKTAVAAKPCISALPEAAGFEHVTGDDIETTELADAEGNKVTIVRLTTTYRSIVAFYAYIQKLEKITKEAAEKCVAK